MRWHLGADGVTESTQLAASKPGLLHPPMTVTVDNFDYTRAHATVMMNDACLVQDIRSLDDTGGGQCSFTIQSEHAELLVILPISLATLLVSMEAAHREHITESEIDDRRRRGLSDRVKPPLKVVPDDD